MRNSRARASSVGYLVRGIALSASTGDRVLFSTLGWHGGTNIDLNCWITYIKFSIISVASNATSARAINITL